MPNHMGLMGCGSGSFSPLSLFPALWLYAGNLATTSGGSTPPSALADPVGQATDLSGNSRHAVQGTAGSRLQYDPTGVNGLPAMKCTGAARWLSTGVLGTPLSQPNTVFCVLRNVDKGATRFALDGESSGGRNGLCINGTGLQWGAYAGGFQYDYAAADAAAVLLTAQYNGSSSLLRRNGCSVPIATNFGTQAMGGMVVGSDSGKTNFPFNGWIREVIAFNSALTLPQIQQVEAFLAARSGVTLYPYATTGAIGADNWYLLVPPTYTGGTRKMLQYHHGRGEAASFPLFSEALMVPMVQAALTAGWFVCASDAGTSTNWGNKAGQDAHAALAQNLRGRESFAKWVFWGRSMGGLTSQALITDPRFGGVDGFFGTYPVCSQTAEYADNASFQAEILSAFSTNAAGLSAACAAYNPLALPAANWAGKPWRATASAADTVVLKSHNADAMSSYVSGQATENTVVATTGDHGDASNFNSTIQADLVSFLGRC